MLSIDSMSSMMIPVSPHRAADGTAKIWLIRSERDWLASFEYRLDNAQQLG